MELGSKECWYNTSMPPEDMVHRVATMESKIDAIYISVEKTRKYFLAMLIGSAALVVVPFVGLLFAIPAFMSTYSQFEALGSSEMDSMNDAELRSLLEGL